MRVRYPAQLGQDALLDKETIEGREVAQLIQQGLSESGEGDGSPLELNITHAVDVAAPSAAPVVPASQVAPIAPTAIPQPPT